MKRLSFLAMFIAMVLSASAQYYMHVWSDGATYSMPVLNVDSVTFTDGPLENVPNEPQEPAQGIGVFSVGEGKTVTFSPGNLQYTQSTNTWSFASTQWEILGTDNVTGGSVESDPTYGDKKSGTALADKVDLFGWSTSTTNFGVSTSKDYEDYSGSFVDWGTNKIGNDAPNTWRTLSKDEWMYIFYNRPNAQSLFALGSVNGVNGTIILPDNWTTPDGVSFVASTTQGLSWNGSFYYNSNGNNFSHNTYTAEQWQTMEQAGAVFLPASGYRWGTDALNVGSCGGYWSSTELSESCVYFVLFDSRYLDPQSDSDRSGGFSVRLVKHVEGETTEPEIPEEDEEPETPTAGIGVFSVGEGKTVTFSPSNLQYTQSTNTWSFASAQWEMLGTDNVIGGSVSSDQYGEDKSGTALADKVDLFGWSTNTTNFGVSTSTDYDDYYGSFVDWGTNKIGNDAPNTWRTLTNEEWYYLRYDRTNANDLCGVAQVNGVNGLIFLPDNWTCPAGVTFKSGFHKRGVDYYAAYQTFTADQWSKLEKSGAVFLPASGDRYGSSVYAVQNYGGYWSATGYDSYYAYFLSFYSDEAHMFSSFRIYGLSVRLVKDVEDETTEPEIPEEDEEPETPTAGIGVFSVGEGKTVTFSPGNLQYTQSTDTWSFANAQYEVLGIDNVTGGSVTSDQYGDSKSGTALADKIDLFCWSTSATNFGVSISINYNDYSGSFVDWGTNQIGNDAPNTWRTLTYDEWYYLRYNRTNANDLCGVAQVNGVNGLIFLPDNWTCPAGVTFKSGFHSEWGVDYYATYQSFTADKWERFEAAGAVFLSADGYRYDRDVFRVQYSGYYWSATEHDSEGAEGFYCDSKKTGIGDSCRCSGQAVRLVKDVE